MLLAFFWGIKLFCSSKFEILMLFDLNNLSFYHCHSRASSIKNIPHLGLALLSMAKWISKYIDWDKFWTLWGCFGYLCSLKQMWDKLTHPCLITSFQTLPEIGLIVNWLSNKLKIFEFLQSFLLQEAGINIFFIKKTKPFLSSEKLTIFNFLLSSLIQIAGVNIFTFRKTNPFLNYQNISHRQTRSA